jgi:hypothetical protein
LSNRTHRTPEIRRALLAGTDQALALPGCGIGVPMTRRSCLRQGLRFVWLVAVVRRSTPMPKVVSLGIVSLAEFRALPLDDQRGIEVAADRLFRRYGGPWLIAEHVRLREELSFAYGV